MNAVRAQPSRRGRSARRNSSLVAAGILASRVTGLARERALSHFAGTSFAADAFTAAYRVPNMLQHLLGEGVLSAAFIPGYSRLLAEGRERDAGRVAGAVLGLLAAATGALALLGVVLAEPLTIVLAAGLKGQTFDLTVTLVRILFPATGLLVLSAWCLGVLNSHRRFFMSYVAPVVMNVVQVAVLVTLGVTVLAPDAAGSEADRLGALMKWLAVGTVGGGLLQFVVQLPAVLRVDRNIRPSVRTDLAEVRTMGRSFWPVLGARGVVQLSHFVQLLLASFLAAGALSMLRYSQTLYALPVALFGMSVAAAELPELSRDAEGDVGASTRRLRAGLARIAAFVVPTTVGYLVLGDVITATVLQSGRFDRTDSVAVWIVLGAYSLGLLATTSARLLQSALYGAGDTRTPARAAIVRVAVSAVLGAALMLQLDRVGVRSDGLDMLGDLPAFAPVDRGDGADAADATDVARLGAVGLALGSAVAAWLEYGMLRRAVHRRIGVTRLGGGELRIVGAAALAAAAVAVAMRFVVADLHPITAGLVAVGVTAAVYVAAAVALGVSEITAAVSAVRRRLPGR